MLSLEDLKTLARRPPTPLRLADMYQWAKDQGQRKRNAQFLHHELPIRLAQRAVDLLTLPHGLSASSESIRQVAANYLDLICQIQAHSEPMTEEAEETFTALLHSSVLDRAMIPTAVADGMQEWLSSSHLSNAPSRERRSSDPLAAWYEHEMEEALYRFFMARVGLRFITEHYVLSSKLPSVQTLRSKISLFGQDHVSVNDHDHLVGCIHDDCLVAEEVRRVAHFVQNETSAALPADRHCPEIVVVDCSKEQQPFTFVPQHLHYITAELLRHSVQSTLTWHYEDRSLDSGMAARDRSQPPPAVRVFIAKGHEDVTIKIADKGGGLPRSRMQTIWKFTHSKSDEDGKYDFSLPLARIYARYFGGELTLKSTEGYGLDSYVYLPRLGDRACENLPRRVRLSPGELDSTVEDWEQEMVL